MLSLMCQNFCIEQEDIFYCGQKKWTGNWEKFVFSVFFCSGGGGGGRGPEQGILSRLAYLTGEMSK